MCNIINFSGGRSSAYMTKRLIDEGLKDYIVLFQNTGKESNETLDFVNECDKRWNLKVVWLEYRTKNSYAIVDYQTASRNGEPFTMAIEDNNVLPGSFMRFCTRLLKLLPAEKYIKSLGITQYDKYLGIRYDEPRRWMKRVGTDDEFMPLVKWKITKSDIFNYWHKSDFDLNLDEPFGNCDLCFHKKKTKVKHIAKHYPEKLKWWIDLENKYGKYFRDDGPMQFYLDTAHIQLDMFEDNGDEIECFCTVD
jgi:3'-phosphoadenosine 5'-phosphosulfate sulfotransferase (PAPS reductase)/FAD synthetase